MGFVDSTRQVFGGDMVQLLLRVGETNMAPRAGSKQTSAVIKKPNRVKPMDKVTTVFLAMLAKQYIRVVKKL